MQAGIAPASGRLGRLSLETLVLLAIGLVAALQFTQIFVRPINWDEFWHYTHIVQLQAGMEVPVIQHLHARAFGWVTLLPGTPIDHIIAIRVAMIACEFVAAVAIASIASRFASRSSALLAVLAYISFTYVFQHGYSFRFDPPLAAVLMSLSWMLLRAPLGRSNIAVCGVLVALLPLMSMKAVLYAPVISGVVWLRWSEEGFASAFLIRMGAIVGVAVVTFVALYLACMSAMTTTALAQGSGTIASAPASVFQLFDNPNWTRLVRAAVGNPLVTLLVICFPVVLARSPRPLTQKVALAGLFAPVLIPAFYVNTAPYFFVFMLPPVLAAASIVIERARDFLDPKIMVLIFLGITGVTLATQPPSVLQQQRDLRAATIATFGEDVRYIDFPGFLGTPGKANIFLSPLAADMHRRAAQTMIEPVLERETVPLLIVNNFILEQLVEEGDSDFLDPRDSIALLGNYTQFWGPLWIAGRDVAAGDTVRFDNRVPGKFTVSGGDLEVDGVPLKEGETITLDRRSYNLAAGPQGARLIWGDGLRAPATPPPSHDDVWEPM